MQYDVYGIGHALVDIEVHIDRHFLQQTQIEKGKMTLMDAVQQQELLTLLGHSEQKRSCGGSAANTIIAIAQFGGATFFSCKVGDDDNATFFASEMTQTGVDHRLLHSHPQPGTTGCCAVLLTPDADRTLCTHLGISQFFSPSDLVEEALAAARYLYIEGYLVTADITRQAAITAVHMARQHGVKTALTFSDPNMVRYFGDGMAAIIGDGIDLLFCNEDEAQAYCQSEDSTIIDQTFKKICHSYCITMGARGARLFDGNQHYTIPGHAVNAIDTNGAGDLFAGAFLYGITHGQLSFEQAGKLASLASSQLVTQYGARLAAHQAQNIWQRFQA